MSNHSEKWLILGGVVLAGGLIVAVGLMQRRRMDPLAQASKLISRCNEKISEIEESVAGLQSIAQAA